ncbi:MAG TPA: hypothetical protein PLA68_18535, partial [Panacibacter sp.]|nr:hypothetical protein [Panacibacter sp.]
GLIFLHQYANPEPFGVPAHDLFLSLRCIARLRRGLTFSYCCGSLAYCAKMIYITNMQECGAAKV